tara:strand:+ start:3693 stop:4283 length:591 start_codon:yes stop_codon:yes gene_type:complete
MKLTKSKLKQVIKEELERILEHDYLPPFGSEFDLENYPITDEEKESDRISDELESAWVDAGGDPKWLGYIDDQILDIAMAVRDGQMSMEKALETVVSLQESEKYDERDPQQKHDLGPGGWERFAYTEKGDSLKDKLIKILKRWETTKYESDKERWQEYAADIEDLLSEPMRLGIPKEDPMGRGASTSSLRRKVTNK